MGDPAPRSGGGFLAQALLQPIFYLFIFGRVLPEIGAAPARLRRRSCCPASSALTLVLTALQNTALPLVIEFSFTKEIEDRLLAPLPGWARRRAEDGDGRGPRDHRRRC